MPVYSFSQVQIYLQCPLKYKFRYVDKIIPEFEENLHLILWTSVHSALEELYNQVNNFKTPKLEEIQQFFIKNFLEKAEKIQASQEEIETFLTRGKTYLENFYKKHYPFEDIKVVDTEMQLYIDLWDGVKFQGFVDRLDKKWKDFVLTDYKTNKNLPASDKTLYEEQLTLYALWIKQKYGKYFEKIFGNLEYLHFDIQDFWEITNEDIETVRQKYFNLVKEIEKLKAEENLGLEAFKPQESGVCKFCEYREICPLFKHFYTDIEDFELPDKVVRQLVDKYVQLVQQKKQIEDETKQIKQTLEKVIEKTKLKKLVWEKHSISVSKLVYYKILNKEKLKEYLNKKELLQEALDIDKTKLKKLIEAKKLGDTTGLVEQAESWVLRGRL